MEQSVRDKLDSHDWEDSLLRLTAYVIMLCRFRKWKLPDSTEPEDIVIEAITRVYEGQRVWNPEQDPGLEDYMKSVLKSMVSNLMTLSGKKVALDKFPSLRSDGGTDEEATFNSLDENIRRFVSTDAELALVYKAIKDGFKPREIAKDYAIPIQDVRNAQKKLRRSVIEIIEKTE
jgi:hypothetical protein